MLKIQIKCNYWLITPVQKTLIDLTIMILKRRPTTTWMSVMLGITMLSASVFTSCQKDSAVVPTTTNTNTLDKGKNSSGVAPTKNTGITTGGTTTGSTGSSTKFTYKASAPISLSGQSNITISGDSINGGSSVGIRLSNCTNVHITKCRIQNTTNDGIQLSNCTNVIID